MSAALCPSRASGPSPLTLGDIHVFEAIFIFNPFASIGQSDASSNGQETSQSNHIGSLEFLSIIKLQKQCLKLLFLKNI